MIVLEKARLQKMSTERLLNIRRNLSARLGYLHFHEGNEWANEELSILIPFDTDLRDIMASRENVEREHREGDDEH